MAMAIFKQFGPELMTSRGDELEFFSPFKHLQHASPRGRY